MVYTAVNVELSEVPGANESIVDPLTATLGSVTNTLVKVTFPELATVKLYFIWSPALGPTGRLSST